MGENGAVLTGESFFIVLPHGNKVPQAWVELLHDGLESKGRRDLDVSNGNSTTTINTHENCMAYQHILGGRRAYRHTTYWLCPKFKNSDICKNK